MPKKSSATDRRRSKPSARPEPPPILAPWTAARAVQLERQRRGIAPVRAGRPPFPPDQQRADPISVRPTPAQRAAIVTAAGAAGLSVSAWMLQAAEQRIARETDPPTT